VYFLLAGAVLLPYPGLQNDEVLFATAVYDARRMPAVLSVFHKPLPLMILPYLGTLKAWIYTPLARLFDPSIWQVRLPVLLLGAATIWLFFNLTDRLAGRRAAVIATALLATDTTFLLTTVFDWGPVVLQRLLAVGGVLLLVRHYATGSTRDLGAGFFLFGLGVWDKALFGWTLAGLAAGLLVAAPQVLRKSLNIKRVTVAVLCLLLGAYPLIRYNAKHRLETFRSTVGWSMEGWPNKLYVLASSLDGSSLIGYLTVDDPADRSRAPRTVVERASVWTDRVTGSWRSGWLGYALGLSILAMPLVWKSGAGRIAVFALTSVAVSYGFMLFGEGVGGATHHVSLLWPWPHLLVAAVLAGVAERFGRGGALAAVLATAAVCASAVLASNVYLSQFIRNGAAGSWSDAILPLAARLKPMEGQEIVVLDWGIFEPLRWLHKGRLHLVWGAEPLRTPSPGAAGKAEFARIVEPPSRVFVAHADGQEQFAGVNARFRAMLSEAGYRRRDVEVVRDSVGRPVFEIFTVRLP
jgi:4-amino-4-deoxy-L-arabinose transferase-like glycosyltransferase